MWDPPCDLLVPGVMREVRRVPDDDVRADDCLAVQEAVELGTRVRANRAVVQLVGAVPQRSEVPNPVGIGHPVVRPWYQQVTLPAGEVANPPAALAVRVALAADLVTEPVPVPVMVRQRRIVVLAHQVVAF